MYGMIHRGVRQMVITDFGEATWDGLSDSISILPEHLISARVYSDDITLRILQKAATVYDISFDDLLRKFGFSWVGFVQRGAYSSILNFIGNDMASFISNLNRMHSAVIAMMPEASLPTFRLVSDQPSEMVVEYTSERAGLEPFVIGLFEGLLNRFGHNGSVSLFSSDNNVRIFTIEKN